MIPEVIVHPLDLNRWQMELHKNGVYKHAKGTMRCKANKMPQADISQVIDNISSMVYLSDQHIQNMKNQFNTDKKITFDEFLQLLQREAFFRETLAEAQIYHQSAKRFVYSEMCQLVQLSQLPVARALVK